MSRKSGLGKGLGALIPNDITVTPESDDGVAALRELPIAAVSPNRLQPRRHFDEESLVTLTASIRELGVLQPILVRPVDDGFELIAGERRWRSAKRAGLTTIPAIVRTVDDQVSLEHAIVENLHRQDLNPIEEAAAYQQLLDDFELSQVEVAERVGKSRSAVANTLRLLHLAPSVQRLLIDGLLTAGHARALLGVDSEPLQEEMATRIIADGLTVRQVEALMRGDGPSDAVPTGSTATDTQPNGSTPGESNRGSTPTDPEESARSAALLDLENLLADQLDTRVSVEMGAKHGRILVDFADLDDLERIARLVVSGNSPS